MKFRLFALIAILVLSLIGWTQEAPATPAAPNSTPASEAKGCCHHDMDGMKDGEGCCHPGAAKGDKTAMECCGSKCERHESPAVS